MARYAAFMTISRSVMDSIGPADAESAHNAD